MRKHYLDNIRWITIICVVIYHVIYMFNGDATAGVVGPCYKAQYQDAIQYILYPWMMILLFIVAGMCSRYYLKSHSIKEFVKSRTTKLLVPSTIGRLFYIHRIKTATPVRILRVSMQRCFPMEQRRLKHMNGIQIGRNTLTKVTNGGAPSVLPFMIKRLIVLPSSWLRQQTDKFQFVSRKYVLK